MDAEVLAPEMYSLPSSPEDAAKAAVQPQPVNVPTDNYAELESKYHSDLDAAVANSKGHIGLWKSVRSLAKGFHPHIKTMVASRLSGLPSLAESLGAPHGKKVSRALGSHAKWLVRTAAAELAGSHPGDTESIFDDVTDESGLGPGKRADYKKALSRDAMAPHRQASVNMLFEDYLDPDNHDHVSDLARDIGGSHEVAASFIRAAKEHIASQLKHYTSGTGEHYSQGEMVAYGERAEPDSDSDDYRGLHRSPGPDNSPLHNLQDTYPDDIYGPHGHRYYGHGNDALDRATIDVIRKARNQPEMMVDVFRAVPKTVRGKAKTINHGDWVTINRNYAALHGDGPLGGNYHILTKKVPAKHLFNNGDSIHEWGYHPSEDYAAADDLITYGTNPPRPAQGVDAIAASVAQRNPSWSRDDHNHVAHLVNHARTIGDIRPGQAGPPMEHESFLMGLHGNRALGDHHLREIAHQLGVSPKKYTTSGPAARKAAVMAIAEHMRESANKSFQRSSSPDWAYAGHSRDGMSSWTHKPSGRTIPFLGWAHPDTAKVKNGWVQSGAMPGEANAAWTHLQRGTTATLPASQTPMRKLQAHGWDADVHDDVDDETAGHLLRMAGAGGPYAKITREKRDGKDSHHVQAEGPRGQVEFSMHDDYGGKRVSWHWAGSKDVGHGFGVDHLADMVDSAKALGVERISAQASNIAGMTGYKVWPKMGFDAPIPPKVAAKLPSGLADAKTIQDLYRTREGRRWWEENGETVDVNLDLGNLHPVLKKALERRQGKRQDYSATDDARELAEMGAGPRLEPSRTGPALSYGSPRPKYQLHHEIMSREAVGLEGLEHIPRRHFYGVDDEGKPNLIMKAPYGHYEKIGGPVSLRVGVFKAAVRSEWDHKPTLVWREIHHDEIHPPRDVKWKLPDISAPHYNTPIGLYAGGKFYKNSGERLMETDSWPRLDELHQASLAELFPGTERAPFFGRTPGGAALRDGVERLYQWWVDRHRKKTTDGHKEVATPEPSGSAGHRVAYAIDGGKQQDYSASNLAGSATHVGTKKSHIEARLGINAGSDWDDVHAPGYWMRVQPKGLGLDHDSETSSGERASGVHVHHTLAQSLAQEGARGMLESGEHELVLIKGPNDLDDTGDVEGWVLPRGKGAIVGRYDFPSLFDEYHSRRDYSAASGVQNYAYEKEQDVAWGKDGSHPEWDQLWEDHYAEQEAQGRGRLDPLFGDDRGEPGASRYVDSPDDWDPTPDGSGLVNIYTGEVIGGDDPDLSPEDEDLLGLAPGAGDQVRYERGEGFGEEAKVDVSPSRPRSVRVMGGYTKESPLRLAGKEYVSGQRIHASELERATPDELALIGRHAPGYESPWSQQGKSWVHRHTGERRYQDHEPLPQYLRPETAEIINRRRSSPPDIRIATHPLRAHEDGLHAFWEDHFGSPYSHESLAGLLGSPKGSSFLATSLGVGGAGPGVSIFGDSHQISHMSRLISVDQKTGQPFISNRAFFVRPSARGRGLGLEVFRRQVQEAANLGIQHIQTDAGKGDGMNGWVTWPKFGYNMEINDYLRRKMPKELQGAKTLQQVLAMPGGGQWWAGDSWDRRGEKTGKRGHGQYVAMKFDLTPGSESMVALNRYLAAKGLPPIQVDEAKRNEVIAKRAAAADPSNDGWKSVRATARRLAIPRDEVERELVLSQSNGLPPNLLWQHALANVYTRHESLAEHHLAAEHAGRGAPHGVSDDTLRDYARVLHRQWGSYRPHDHSVGSRLHHAYLDTLAYLEGRFDAPEPHVKVILDRHIAEGRRNQNEQS